MGGSNGFNEIIEAAMRNWDRWKRKQRISDDSIQEFTNWLIKNSGLVVPASRHEFELAKTRANLEGDVQFLMLIGEIERGRLDFTLSTGMGRDIVGAGEINPRRLPRYAKEGASLLVSISRPICRKCGADDEPGEKSGWVWFEPDLCSRCARQKNGARQN